MTALADCGDIQGDKMKWDFIANDKIWSTKQPDTSGLDK